MPRLSSRDGFALPMSILVLAIITVALAAGFSSTIGEITTNSAQRSQNRAYNIAEAGLEQFMVRRSESGFCQHCGDPLVVDSEWTRLALNGGYADIVAVKVRPKIGTGNALYFIRSKGTDTTTRLNAATTQFAERTVGVYAVWNTVTINVLAGWVSLSGLTKNGTGEISGVDQCGQSPDVAGIMVQPGDLHIAGGSFDPTGSPPVDTTNTLAQLKDKVGIDWAAVVEQNAIPADYEIPPQSFPTAAEFSADPDFWPVIRIHTNGYSLPNAGRGMIIADSDFVITGSNMWDGVVLVGGKLKSDGNNTTAGATLSGLNFLIGGTPSPSSVDDALANGQKTYVYNSCNVSNATTKLKRYSSLPNTWMDNVASW
jgi:hypothetical protein